MMKVKKLNKEAEQIEKQNLELQVRPLFYVHKLPHTNTVSNRRNLLPCIAVRTKFSLLVIHSTGRSGGQKIVLASNLPCIILFNLLI
jgi:hypothetical protein